MIEIASPNVHFLRSLSARRRRARFWFKTDHRTFPFTSVVFIIFSKTTRTILIKLFTKYYNFFNVYKFYPDLNSEWEIYLEIYLEIFKNLRFGLEPG